MAQHFTEDIIERIRDAADIIAVISEHLPLKKLGENFKALCPFHMEKTPSFTVNSEKQLFKCFGCGKGGNVFHFLMEMENLTFPEAVETLANQYNVALPEYSRPEEEKVRGVLEALNWSTQFFQKYLASSAGESTRNYLSSRNISNETKDIFSLGYAPSGWNTFLNEAVKEGFSEKTLVDAGLVSEKNGKLYDKFRNRLMFPIRNHRGKVVAFGGRVLSKEDQPKYLNSPETSVFSKKHILYGFESARSHINEDRPLLVMEGYTDVLMAHQYGFCQAVATLGTALGKEHTSLIRRYTNSVVLIFDGDEAGLKAASRSISFFLNQGIIVKIAIIPDSSDPYDFLLEKGKDAFQSLVEKAEDFFDFRIRQLNKKYNLSDVSSQRQAVEELKKSISEIPDEITRRLFVKKISTHFQLPAEILAKDLKYQQKTKRPEQNKAWEISKEKRCRNEEKFILSVALNDPKRAEEIFTRYAPSSFCDAQLAHLAHLILQRIQNKDSLNIANMTSSLESNLAQELVSIACDDSISEGMDEEKKEENLRFIFKGVERRKYKNKLLEIRKRGPATTPGQALKEARDAYWDWEQGKKQQKM